MPMRSWSISSYGVRCFSTPWLIPGDNPEITWGALNRLRLKLPGRTTKRSTTTRSMRGRSSTWYWHFEAEHRKGMRKLQSRGSHLLRLRAPPVQIDGMRGTFDGGERGACCAGLYTGSCILYWSLKYSVRIANEPVKCPRVGTRAL
jgi:hypothetical protein